MFKICLAIKFEKKNCTNVLENGKTKTKYLMVQKVKKKHTNLNVPMFNTVVCNLIGYLI